MKRLNWNNIRLLLMLIAIVTLYAFGLERNKKRLVSGPEVEFLGDSKLFITEESVNKLLIENLGNRQTLVKDELFLKLLENVLTKNQMIEEAEVFVTTDGRLKTEVKQKTPVARIYEGGRSFYIDYQGSEMPLSKNFSARVPLVSARFEEQGKTNLTSLLRYIYDDEFLKKNIISVEMKDDKSVVMKNRNYGYTISFGRADEIERKFDNYKAFFQKASNDSLIEKYRDINLKFTRQVVCTKY